MDPVERIEWFLALVTDWAAARPDVDGLVLVGSWARGTAGAGSDVDLVLVVAEPAAYLADRAWLRRFGSLGVVAVEDWGLVRSLRVFYEEGLEVEFGLTTRGWAATTPLDPGTARVVEDGARILLDRTGDLGRLVAAVRDEHRHPVGGWPPRDDAAAR